MKNGLHHVSLKKTPPPGIEAVTKRFHGFEFFGTSQATLSLDSCTLLPDVLLSTYEGLTRQVSAQDGAEAWFHIQNKKMHL